VVSVCVSHLLVCLVPAIGSCTWRIRPGPVDQNGYSKRTGFPSSCQAQPGEGSGLSPLP
jgi:hypothetical protein